MHDRIDKGRSEPAYAQLAAILRRQIAAGAYPPGEKIPAEASIGKRYRLSTMTVRQAVGVLTEQGLLERVHGSGTFVKPLRLGESNFVLEGLREIFQDPERTHVRVLSLGLGTADARTAEALQLHEGARIVIVRRLLLQDGIALMLHEGRIRYDPRRPTLEAEMSVGPLSHLFNGEGARRGEAAIKKGELSIAPAVLGEEEASLLGLGAGTSVFVLEYRVYDFEDVPQSWGWFKAPPGAVRLKTRLGIWEDA